MKLVFSPTIAVRVDKGQIDVAGNLTNLIYSELRLELVQVLRHHCRHHLHFLFLDLILLTLVEVGLI